MGMQSSSLPRIQLCKTCSWRIPVPSLVSKKKISFLYLGIDTEVKFWLGYSKKGHIHINAHQVPYYRTMLRHPVWTLSYPSSKLTVWALKNKRQEISQANWENPNYGFLPSVFAGENPCLSCLINGNRKLTCRRSVILLTSAFCLVFIMEVNYLRPSQKRPRLLRIQNVCFIPVKFPESPATGYGELMLKNLNGG